MNAGDDDRGGGDGPSLGEMVDAELAGARTDAQRAAVYRKYGLDNVGDVVDLSESEPGPGSAPGRRGRAGRR